MPPNTRVRRLPQRASYDREVIDAILDEGLVCHLGLIADGAPLVVPSLQARIGDHVYFHGSAASRTLRAMSGGVDACLTVTLIDGLVLARSAFHHSVNYRSVMVFGEAEMLRAAEEKTRALSTFIEKLAPERWPDVRPPSVKELKATAVLRLPIRAASAKVRTGPPLDDVDDLGLGVWAGVIPLELRRLAPEPDPTLSAGIELPEYLREPWERSAQETTG